MKLRNNLFLFFIGLGGALYVKQFGTFAVAEPMLLMVSLLFLFRAFKLPRCFIQLFLATLLWVFGIIVSDLYNHSFLEDSIKFIGSALLFFFNILAFYIMFKENTNGAIYFAAGLMISYLLQYYFFPPPVAQIDFISGFYGQDNIRNVWIAITHFVPLISIAGLFWVKGWWRVSLIILLVTTIGVLYLGSRAYFIVGIFSLLFLYKSKQEKLNNVINNSNHYSPYKFLKSSLLIILGLYGAIVIYEYLAVSGILGDTAFIKYTNQADSSFSLASGRVDFFQALYVISQNPIIGYGSYALDKEGLLRDFSNLTGDYFHMIKDHLPAHSHILGAWVWSGFLSLPFWLLIFYRVSRSLFINYDQSLDGIRIPFTFYILWNILFSPLGFRVDLCYLVGLVFALDKIYEKK